VRTARAEKLLLHEKKLRKKGFAYIAGVDEAGRGPLAGPVVASAVILKEFTFENRIDDSKKLSPPQREKAYREILTKAVVGIGIVSEKAIDDINIYQATRRAMEEAVAGLAVPPDYIIVDGKMPLRSACTVQCIIRGDSQSLSIAAASIVAKVTRDRIMLRYDKKYPHYGFCQHKGYPTRRHKAALCRHGASPIHRMSFRPVRELQEA